MSGYLKHTTNLFLGVAELNRMQQFLDDDGYRTILLKNSASFGIVKYEADPTFNNFKVVEDISGSGNYKIENESFAIDSTGKIIRQLPLTNQAIPSDGVWRWIKIAHAVRTLEIGTVAIDINGNITGTGTSFTDILRGQPDFPSKIKFTNSAGNLLEYEVVEVLSDTTALLAGTTFIAETDLTYEVVGTFTPGYVPSAGAKNPFQYDGCLISLVTEVTPNVAPTKTDGVEFYIARVRNVGGVLQIHDKRTEQYRTTAEFNLSNIIKMANPLIGVETVKFDHDSTARDRNIVEVGFGMRTAAWTLDAPNRAITFSTGDLDAGKFKSTSQFSDNDLNGWRIYYKDGSYSTIHLSEKQGTAIKCTVKEVDPSKLTTGDILRVVPSVDQVELRARSSFNSIPVAHVTKAIEASNGVGTLELVVPQSTYVYVIEYRYIKNGETSEWLQIPSDLTNGFLDESSFDDNGVISSPTNRKTYTTSSTNGFIQLVRPGNSYVDTVDLLTTGDLYGYGTFTLNNGSSNRVFTAGTDFFVQRCAGVSGGGPMTVNHVIGLKQAPAVAGNSFTFIFDVGIASQGFCLSINSNYVSAGTPGTIIKEFTEEDFDFPYLVQQAVVIKCTFNGSTWDAYVVEQDPHRIADIKMVGQITIAGVFDGSGLGILGGKHQGWALCNGNNGTLDLAEKFVVGYDKDGTLTPTSNPDIGQTNYGEIGNEGGDRVTLLTEAQMPSHNHTTVAGGQHTHSMSTDPGHIHTYKTSNTGGGAGLSADSGGADRDNSPPTDLGGSHFHTINLSDAHTHIINDAGGDGIHENRPPYVVVGYIQRVKQS